MRISVPAVNGIVAAVLIGCSGLLITGWRFWAVILCIVVIIINSMGRD